MREMALGKVREAKNGLTDPNLGDRRKGEYAVMFSEWQENYIHALDRIQELYIEYYTSTVELLEGKNLYFITVFYSLSSWYSRLLFLYIIYFYFYHCNFLITSHAFSHGHEFAYTVSATGPKWFAFETSCYAFSGQIRHFHNNDNAFICIA